MAPVLNPPVAATLVELALAVVVSENVGVEETFSSV